MQHCKHKLSHTQDSTGYCLQRAFLIFPYPTHRQTPHTTDKDKGLKPQTDVFVLISLLFLIIINLINSCFKTF